MFSKKTGVLDDEAVGGIDWGTQMSSNDPELLA